MKDKINKFVAKWLVKYVFGGIPYSGVNFTNNHFENSTDNEIVIQVKYLFIDGKSLGKAKITIEQ